MASVYWTNPAWTYCTATAPRSDSPARPLTSTSSANSSSATVPKSVRTWYATLTTWCVRFDDGLVYWLVFVHLLTRLLPMCWSTTVYLVTWSGFAFLKGRGGRTGGGKGTGTLTISQTDDDRTLCVIYRPTSTFDWIVLWLFFWIPSKPFIRHQQFTLIAQKICDFLINNGIFPLKNDHHSMSSTRLGWSRWLPPSIASCYYQRAQRMPAVNCDTCLWRYMATRVTITMAVGDWEFGGGLCSISPWLTVSLSVVSWRSLAHLSRSAVRLCVPLNPRFASMVLVFLTSLWSYLFLGQIAFT